MNKVAALASNVRPQALLAIAIMTPNAEMTLIPATKPLWVVNASVNSNSAFWTPPKEDSHLTFGIFKLDARVTIEMEECVTVPKIRRISPLMIVTRKTIVPPLPKFVNRELFLADLATPISHKWETSNVKKIRSPTSSTSAIQTLLPAKCLAHSRLPEIHVKSVTIVMAKFLVIKDTALGFLETLLVLPTLIPSLMKPVRDVLLDCTARKAVCVLHN